ncbi:signal transducer CD24 [Rhineura floridana]|uniref:signal transducer CD24 n=1 Tax=Rhineura floridana TaxID=261503 RepID=UPI002AC84500|nr:signal transducer CD24 [Rhineura floridana]
MGTAVTTRLGLGLLFLALLVPALISDNNATTISASNNNSGPTSVPVGTLNNTTKGHGSSLQSTTGLFILSVSLLYVC